jgi:prepilin-type processing-associated H-X9-DG protein
LVDVRKPELTILFGDGEWANGANKFMRSPLPSEFGSELAIGGARHAGTQGFRHRRRTNAGFADGHAESLAERHTAGNTSVTEGTGYISKDNELYDLR